jgi:hypothetical protein
MRVANFSENSAVIEVDLQELKILGTALNALCNGGRKDDLEEGLGGTREKAESLLISILSLNSLLER